MACKPWLLEELQVVRPQLVVALGATAAQSLMGRSFRLTQSRGKFFQIEGQFHGIATLHPSAVLRMPSHEDRVRARAELAEDLARAREFVERGQAGQAQVGRD
jgi:DNA polymerase